MISELSSFRDYAALQLKLGASKEEIRQAYLDLAKVWHPDRFAGNERLQKIAEEKMMEITAAYRALLEDPDFDVIEHTNPAASAPPPPRAQPVREKEPPVPAGQRVSEFISNLTRKQLWMIGGGVVVIGGLLGLILSPSRPQPIGGWRITTSDESGEATIQRRALAAHATAGTTAPAVGEIQINNQMHSDAEMKIALAANPDNALQSAAVPSDATAIIHNLGAATYVIDLSFSDHKTPSVRLGPFEIVQVTNANGVEADRYEVTLKPNKK